MTSFLWWILTIEFTVPIYMLLALPAVYGTIGYVVALLATKGD